MRNNPVFLGVTLAVIAVLIWSGNFIIARAVSQRVSPVTLAFFRWGSATVIILPLAYRAFIAEFSIFRRHWKYFCWVALSGITLFNTFVYVAGHFSSAINLALIGTTSSPIMAIILAAVFLNEKITTLRITGMIFCIAGILLLLSGGSFQKLINLHFSEGDLWVLTGAFCFAVYNTLVRKKPKEISALNFLFIVFALGSAFLIPLLILESQFFDPPVVVFDRSMFWIVLYLGAGTSVIAYLCWNYAISQLGSGRTALFGNLIPLFASIEAVIILREQFTWLHLTSSALVVSGLIIANVRQKF